MSKDSKKRVRDRIYACERSGGLSLNLSDCEMTALSKATKVTTLQNLVVSHNLIPDLDGISRLKSLQVLDASYNEIAQLPSEVFKLSYLNELIVSYNLLSTVTDDVTRLQNLRVLDVSGNNAIGHNLPAGLTALRQLEVLGYAQCGVNSLDATPVLQLRSLRSLNIGYNDIAVLPLGMSRLVSLENLDISHNHLDAVPNWINALGGLKEFRAANNRLTHLPDTFGNLIRLEFLDLNHNVLTDISNIPFKQMKNMRELHVKGNRLTEFGRGVGHMPCLKIIDLDDNHLETLDREVGWLYDSLRQLRLKNNRLVRLPGDIAYLNPVVSITVQGNKEMLNPFSLLDCRKSLQQISDQFIPYCKAFPPNCVAYGEALMRSSAGKLSKFSIQAKDVGNNHRMNGKDVFTATFHMEEDRDRSLESEEWAYHCVVKDMSDGTYQVAYNIRRSGIFTLEILNDGDPIANSPFEVLIDPGPIDPRFCDVEGEGMKLGKWKATVPCDFTIIARDEYGNQQTSGGESFIINVHGGSQPVALIGDNEDGTYPAQWTPAWPGTYTVEVGYAGYHIKGSPFTVEVPS